MADRFREREASLSSEPILGPDGPPVLLGTIPDRAAPSPGELHEPAAAAVAGEPVYITEATAAQLLVALNFAANQRRAETGARLNLDGQPQPKRTLTQAAQALGAFLGQTVLLIPGSKTAAERPWSKPLLK